MTTTIRITLRNLFCRGMILLTAATALSTNARAVSTDFSNQDSVVLLGFRASVGTGNDKNLLVSLGSMSDFLSGTYQAQFNLSSALAGTYGSDWSRASVLFGAFGSQNAVGDAFDYTSVIASINAPALTDEQAMISPDNAYGFSGIQGNLALSATQGSGRVTGTANATATAGANSIYSGYSWASMPTGNAGTWTFYNSGGGAFYYFSAEQNWTTDTVLRFAKYDPNAVSVPSLTDITASIDTATGIVTVQTVPEPSTYALMGLGLLCLIVVARRRSVVQS